MTSGIILGTAKFGIQDYGFSSSQLRSTHSEMFDLSYQCGIRTLDTSPRYGNAEQIIGAYHANSGQRHFKVCTKVDNLKANSLKSKQYIYNSVERSLQRVGVEYIETLYLHQNEMDIIGDRHIMRALQKMKHDGLVNKIGVSIYSKEECKFALDGDLYDVIQLPVSIMDSFIYSELIDGRHTDKEIIARSVFLQGILFNRGDIKAKVRQSASMFKFLEEMDRLALEFKTDLFAMACAFVLSLPEVDAMIVGTSARENLLRIVNSSKLTMPAELTSELCRLSFEYKEWGNPRNW